MEMQQGMDYQIGAPYSEHQADYESRTFHLLTPSNPLCQLYRLQMANALVAYPIKKAAVREQ